jgi:hypothetical protein
MAALGVAGSATLLAGTAQAVPLGTLAKLAAKLSWGKLVAAISVVGAAAAVPVGYLAWQRHHPATHGGSAPAAIAAKPSEPTPPQQQLPPALIAGGLEAQQAAESTRAGAAGAVHAARPAVTLAHELSSLDAARGLLARGDATGALARLDAYGRAYPHGRLGLEAEVLRIDALDESGRSDAARARAEAFLQRHPHSVLAARVRTRLGD